MSLKKRMFRSNMLILFTALISLMMILLVVLLIFEDPLERQIYSLTETRLERHADEVVQIMDNSEIDSVRELQQKVGKWGYQCAVIADGKVKDSDDIETGEHKKDDTTKHIWELAEYFTAEKDRNEQAELFSVRKATIAAKYLSDQDGWLVAAYFPEGNWVLSSLNSSFYLFIVTIFLTCIVAIAFLMFLASFFTRRMSRMIMEPVDLLVEAAERIKNGNLKEKIDYKGEQEFGHVCQTFNDMQSTILADQEQRARTERARTDMVTGISHDLRTPLTSIRGYIKGVLDGVADTEEKKKTYLETAYESTEEMDRLLQKLFDFSRMESGQMPFHMVKADLTEYAESYAAQKEAMTDPDLIQIHFHRKAEIMPDISMDVEQVRRVLDNLLENSIKYAGVRPVRVDLSVEEMKDHILLIWKDNGTGVPEEKLGRIFDRFYRCDEARREKGSGIGLYVVKYIMERHNGTVEAENNDGLKISLYFPKAD